MWNLLRLALDLTLRNSASTKMLALWFQILTGVGFDTASIKMLPFWTLNLTGVGFEPTHTFVYQKSQRRISWVWRLRPLGHPALSISHLLHPVFDNTFFQCEICFVWLLIWLRNTASTKMLAFWTQVLTGVGFDTASIKLLPFWTLNLTGEGIEPTHTFVSQKSQRRISWVWRP